MDERRDTHDEPEWVRRMRADGFKVRTGTNWGELPFEPEDSFNLPESCDHPREPAWKQRLRATGRIVGPGPGPAGLPFEPEVDLSLAHPPRRGILRRVVRMVRRLFSFSPGSRWRPRDDQHAPVP